MNEDAAVESNEFSFCPICQAPLKNLKVKFSFHITMCDVNWDNLEGKSRFSISYSVLNFSLYSIFYVECKDGVDCSSESIFHFRDYSHQILANHRENIVNKRKRGDDKQEEIISKKSKQKENRIRAKPRSTKTAQPSNEESEDDIFMDMNKSKMSQQSSKKTLNKTFDKSGDCTILTKEATKAKSNLCSTVNDDENFDESKKSPEYKSKVVTNNESDEDSTLDTNFDQESQCSLMSQSIEKACEKRGSILFILYCKLNSTTKNLNYCKYIVYL